MRLSTLFTKPALCGLFVALALLIAMPASADSRSGELTPVVGGKLYKNGTADGVVCSKACDLVGVFVAVSTTCTIKFWDNASAGSTTVFVNTFSASAATWYPIPGKTINGLYIDITNTCDYTVFYNPIDA